jgi:hypothetical protein
MTHQNRTIAFGVAAVVLFDAWGAYETAPQLIAL